MEYLTKARSVLGRDLLIPLPRRVSERLPRPLHATPPTMERYVGTVFQALAIFRFLSFAMGVGLLYSLDQPDTITLGAIVVMVTGGYAIVRVVLRFNPATYGAVISVAALASDIVLSVALVLFTGGLDSRFLIYSLAPILTVSLLMDARLAIAVALASGLSVAGAYVAGNLGLGDYPWILSGNYLAFSLLYIAVCLLISYLPFLANLNWQRRLRAESQASERDKLRRDVHDSVAQTLAFLSLKMKRAEERSGSPTGVLTPRDMADIRSMVERAYLSVRDYLDQPDADEDSSSLTANLTNVVAQWSKDTGLKAEISVRGMEQALAPRTKFHVLQIVREALANVAKHAYSHHTWVTMEGAEGVVRVKVRDDGRGFSSSQPRGHGLGIMTERAALVGATVEVRSTPGEGTEVVITCPCE